MDIQAGNEKERKEGENIGEKERRHAGEEEEVK